MNEHFQYVKGPTTKTVSLDKIALHHYVLKSEEVGTPWHSNCTYT